MTQKRVIAASAVYPACAGIDLSYAVRNMFSECLPRMRGDRPHFRQDVLRHQRFTPHARGSTTTTALDIVANAVYPACAGIDPSLCRPSPAYAGLPRMRGDRPGAGDAKRQGKGFTPHARGSTPEPVFFGDGEAVYPACAGIDHFSRLGRIFLPCLPRMRGDRPGDSYVVFTVG